MVFVRDILNISTSNAVRFRYFKPKLQKFQLFVPKTLWNWFLIPDLQNIFFVESTILLQLFCNKYFDWLKSQHLRTWSQRYPVAKSRGSNYENTYPNVYMQIYFHSSDLAGILTTVIIIIVVLLSIVRIMSQCNRIFGDTIFTSCPIKLKLTSIISTF